MANKLELTWVGKDEPIRIEPRLLIERPELSNTAADPDTTNMLIHGDNLLALKALESKYAGQVKCIYIDMILLILIQRESRTDMKIVVFDLGGTLMEYVNMPLSWVDYYHEGLDAIVQKYNCSVTERQIEEAFQRLKTFNPRITYREIEYSAQYIFTQALEGWNLQVHVKDCIDVFWKGMQLTPVVFTDSVFVLNALKKRGYAISALTDLPSAYPDSLFQKDIAGLLPYFDYYVSSAICGFRKPNCTGLKKIAKHFNTPVSELVFVGDEEKDRETAQNAGCKFIRINRNGADGVPNLLALLEVLG